MSKITESEIELYAIEELENQGFQYLHGPAIAHDGENPMRQDYCQVLLSTKLQEVLPAINPIPAPHSKSILSFLSVKLQSIQSHTSFPQHTSPTQVKRCSSIVPFCSTKTYLQECNKRPVFIPI